MLQLSSPIAYNNVLIVLIEGVNVKLNVLFEFTYRTKQIHKVNVKLRDNAFKMRTYNNQVSNQRHTDKLFFSNSCQLMEYECSYFQS